MFIFATRPELRVQYPLSFVGLTWMVQSYWNIQYYQPINRHWYRIIQVLWSIYLVPYVPIHSPIPIYPISIDNGCLRTPFTSQFSQVSLHPPLSCFVPVEGGLKRVLGEALHGSRTVYCSAACCVGLVDGWRLGETMGNLRYRGFDMEGDLDNIKVILKWYSCNISVFDGFWETGLELHCWTWLNQTCPKRVHGSNLHHRLTGHSFCTSPFNLWVFDFEH